MSLPDALEKLLRAAYLAGREDSTAGGSPLDKTLVRINSMDAPQQGVYGQAARDFLTHVRRALDACPKCGHALHGPACYNMASDNDCSCTFDPAGEWIAELEIGDRLTAIAELDDAIGDPELPSLEIRTPVRFKEGTFVVESYQSNLDSGMSINLVDASRYLEKEWVDPTRGVIDRDIQERVAEMNPSSLGQRVAMEHTLQDKRNHEKGSGSWEG